MKKIAQLLLTLCLAPTLLSAQLVHKSWEEIQEVTARVCDQIPEDSFDVILGISVGGLVPTALFSIELATKNVATISARSYDGQRRGDLSVSNCPELKALAGKRVLIVDDIVDSGATVQKIKRIVLEEYGASDVKIAALFVNKEHGQHPDYWGEESSDWIIFPWEIRWADSSI